MSINSLFSLGSDLFLLLSFLVLIVCVCVGVCWNGGCAWFRGLCDGLCFWVVVILLLVMFTDDDVVVTVMCFGS
jgi:hypothetical protein